MSKRTTVKELEKRVEECEELTSLYNDRIGTLNHELRVLKNFVNSGRGGPSPQELWEMKRDLAKLLKERETTKYYFSLLLCLIPILGLCRISKVCDKNVVLDRNEFPFLLYILTSVITTSVVLMGLLIILHAGIKAILMGGC